VVVFADEWHSDAAFENNYIVFSTYATKFTLFRHKNNTSNLNEYAFFLIFYDKNISLDNQSLEENLTVYYAVIKIHRHPDPRLEIWFDSNETQFASGGSGGGGNVGGGGTVFLPESTLIHNSTQYVYFSIEFSNGTLTIKTWDDNMNYVKHVYELPQYLIWAKLWLRNTNGDTFIWLSINAEITVISKDELAYKVMQYRVYKLKEIDSNPLEQLFYAFIDFLGGILSGLWESLIKAMSYIYSLLPPEIQDLISIVWSVLVLIGQVIWLALDFSILGLQLYIWLTIFEFLNLVIYVFDKMLDGQIEAIHLLAQFMERQINLVMRTIQTVHSIIKTLIPI